MTGKGLTYQVHQCLQVQLPEYSIDLADWLIEAHRQTHHVIGVRDQWETPPHRITTEISDLHPERGSTTGLPGQGE